MAASQVSGAVQDSDASLPVSSEMDSSQAANLLKKLEHKLCPNFVSFHDFDQIGILELLLRCSHLQEPEISTFCLARQIDYTIDDLKDVVRFSKCLFYTNWNYSCMSSSKLNPKPIMIGALRPHKDGSIHLEDATGFIKCVFTSGSTSSISCSVNHKIGLGWSIHCIVAIADFYVVLEKKRDARENVYLVINEDDVIPLTDAIINNNGTNVTNFTPNSSVSLDFLDSFNRLSIRDAVKFPSDVPNSCRYAFTRSPESSHSHTAVHQPLNSSVDSEKYLFICKLIIPIQKTLPALKKKGKIGFRMEVLIVSNVVVENFEQDVLDKIIEKKNKLVSRQALDFYDDLIMNYSKFQMNMVYAYKRPLHTTSEEYLKTLLTKEICCSVINVIEDCQFIPFMKSSEFCPIHSFEDEIFPLPSSKYQRVPALPCLCLVSDKSIGVSDISAPTFMTCSSNINIKGTIDSKEYRDGENDLCGSDTCSTGTVILRLSDSSSKIHLYLKYKNFHSHNYFLGLLPGMEVLLSGLQCRDSKNGNLYLIPGNDLSVQLLQYSPQQNLIVSNEVPVLPEEKEMPLYFFAKISKKMKRFRSISFILRITSLSIEPIMPSGDVASLYLESCPLKMKACFLADDGSEPRFVLCKDETVGQLLSITMGELEALKHLAASVEGGLHFKANRFHESPIMSSSPEMQFLSKLCQRPAVRRQMVLCCTALETNPDYCNEDVFGSTTIFCISMSDTKAVKLSVELFRHINRELC